MVIGPAPLCLLPSCSLCSSHTGLPAFSDLSLFRASVIPPACHTRPGPCLLHLAPQRPSALLRCPLISEALPCPSCTKSFCPSLFSTVHCTQSDMLFCCLFLLVSLSPTRHLHSTVFYGLQIMVIDLSHLIRLFIFRKTGLILVILKVYGLTSWPLIQKLMSLGRTSVWPFKPPPSHFVLVAENSLLGTLLIPAE